MDNVWPALIIGVVTALGGGTGVGTLMRLRHDKKLGVAQQEISADDAVAKRLLDLADAQMRTLVEPLERRVRDAESRIGTLEGQITVKDQEIQRITAAYWRAIAHIRALVAYIRVSFPDSQPPVPHKDIAADL